MNRVAPIAALVAAVALVTWLGLTQKKSSLPPNEALPYQAPVSELSAAEQERLAQLRTQLRVAEKERTATGKWPERLTEDGSCTLRVHGPYVNYLAAPADPSRLRWLVLVIEPQPGAIRDPAPPEDEEHHTLSDGTAVHVTVWTAPNEGALPSVVLPFPAADGWTQRINGR